MKAKLNTAALEAVLQTAPEGHLRISERARRAAEYDGVGFTDRMTLRAVEADRDLQEMLERDADGKSKLSDRERIRLQQFYLTLHPELRQKSSPAALASVTLVLDVKGLAQADATAAEAMRLLEKKPLQIEGPAIEVKGEELQ